MKIHYLPAEINPAKEKPFTEIGQSKVIDSPLGQYREVGDNRNDRVAYLFQTSRRGDLIRLTIIYLDDKTRTAEISIIPSHFRKGHYHTKTATLGSGYLTGHNSHITGPLVRQVFIFMLLQINLLLYLVLKKPMLLRLFRS